MTLFPLCDVGVSLNVFCCALEGELCVKKAAARLRIDHNNFKTRVEKVFQLFSLDKKLKLEEQ